ncbi:MAG: ABC transporter substrate-binding protein [Ilumatobacteraceae bacterium]
MPVALAFVAASCSTEDEGGGESDSPTTEAESGSGGTEAESESTEAESESTEAESETTEGESEGTAAEGGGSGGGSADLEGTEVTVFGPESSEEEAGAMQDALDVFAEENGMAITYVGARDFEEQINAQVAGGNPPDIAIFPQPGKLRDFASTEDVLPLPEDVLTSVEENWNENWLGFWQDEEGTQYGVPNKSDLKSLVWYSPARFAELGYEVPETLDAFFELSGQMIADGNTPLCVGVESGPATGWPFTDWTEEIILRNEGIDYYNSWVAHEVPFDDQPVVDAMAQVADLWAQDGAVSASGGSIVATPFGDNAQGLVDGQCMMHRQANFFASFFPEGTAYGDGEGEIDTFYFPSNEGEPILVAGTSAAAFRDAPEVWAVMQYYGSPEYADARQEAQLVRKGGDPADPGNLSSGYLSANENADPALYSTLDQGFLEVLATGDPAGFDGSDQMPGEVGSGSFWAEATALINGEKDAAAAAAAIEASWPS